jgi:Na+/H+-dicarboxylate symporter
MSRKTVILYLAILTGALLGFSGNAICQSCAEVISSLFINMLKLVSLPLIFLSILSTATSMKDVGQVKALGGKVLKYTLLTTIVAAALALGVFVSIDPVISAPAGLVTAVNEASAPGHGYMDYLIKTVPSNFLAPFIENHVIGVLFLAILLSAAILTLPEERKDLLHFFFSSLYRAVMTITGWIVTLMPIAVMAMVFLFVVEVQSEKNDMKSFALYLLCIVAANLVQAFLFLPLLLKMKKISPIALAKTMAPALSLAFFSKSSSAALPLAIDCMKKNSPSEKVTTFALPLCTTINMNACAAFILITVLFVSMSSGVSYSPVELIGWIFIATLAAIGNAGVPMGCFFLSSALLAAMDVQLSMLYLILPFYSMIDMLESAINVWSDSCVSAIVAKEEAGQKMSGTQNNAKGAKNSQGDEDMVLGKAQKIVIS